MIDHEGPTPLYVQVADAIEARIAAGELLPNRPIPSENQLVQEYGIARGTARKALQLLRERGLVITVVGRGTFVVGQPGTSNE
ncbi:GntR family transcriptional regulator [Actinoplanes sp. NPDC024001]|uniref:GntR family transcriptional regulator n=1 Tax=Actinoplanes sp. NPDC024001 TaxID=3154598 RepID=UPI0033E7403A